ASPYRRLVLHPPWQNPRSSLEADREGRNPPPTLGGCRRGPRRMLTLNHTLTYALHATPPFYHGTRADLAPGDLLVPGHASNYADGKLSWIYFSGTLDAAIWGCELVKGEG